MTKDEHYTIASDAIPNHYELYFKPDLKKFEFSATAKIKMKSEKTTKKIKLNSKDITISRIVAKSKGAEQSGAFKLIDNNELEVEFEKGLIGEFELVIDYTGFHNDKLYGFYRSKYIENNKEEYMLSTQFEAPNARAAFPCLDEPLYKATFDVSIETDEDLEAISNMPVKEVVKKGKKKVYVFERSPIMSTYLLYLGVGKFEKKSGAVGKVKMNVYATPGKSKYQDMPLEYGKKLFADLQNYFEIEYPLPKMDLIAVPDFAAGAMENWGAITFRETALLGNETETTVGGKQRIAEVVAHEIAHMWFGDLVTMVWWDDMWLNESFATYMEYKSVERVFPEWRAMQKYYLDSVASAFVADGLKHTHPISVQVNTAGEISELFDAIGYNKGGSVLLMLEDFVGSKTFRLGLKSYLTKHAYKNATKKDLWAAIEEQCKKEGKTLPVLEVMEDWINREGYPIVSVKSTGNGDYELEQIRFTISGTIDQGVWKIPISYLGQNGEGKLIMDKKKVIIKNAGSWIKINYKQAGFYRVKYEKENLQKLGQMIHEGKLTSLDVWGIENDLFALVRCGDISVSEYVEFVRQYCMEAQYPANVSISGHLSWLNSISHGKKFEGIAKGINIDFHQKIIKKLGYEVKQNESSIDTKMRTIAFTELGLCADAEALKIATKLYEQLKSGGAVNPNLKRPIYYTIAFNMPDQQKFDEFMSKYNGNGSPEEKIISLAAIGNMGDQKLLENALRDAISGKVRLQDSIILLSSISGNPKGRKLYLEWAMKNWQKFMQMYDPSSHMLKNCVGGFGMICDKESYEKVKTFLTDKKNLRDDIKLEALQTMERIEANMKLLEKNGG